MDPGRRASLAAIGLAVLVAAGCGGSGTLSKAQYEKKVQAAGARVRTAFLPLTAQPSSLSQLAAEVAAGQRELRKAGDELAALAPPKDVAADNAKLATSLRALANDLEPLRRAASAGDARAARAAIQRIATSGDVKAGEQATNDMKRKGYAIGALGAP